MNQLGAITIAEELPESQKSALLNLLADEDPAVYTSIREKILSFGPSAADWLRPHLLSRDPLLRRRSQQLVLRFDRQAADDRFLGFCLKNGEDFNLEEGAWLLAQTHYPEINVGAYGAILDFYAKDLRDRICSRDEPRAILVKI